ncbi:MMPL family transporter [Paenibacillus qinlingensis]|uniref:RND superfamily putative drug exporter n=1 Tax=Paenibacillus qinlingensis TaxID=1837343 RepID=A0ABU1NWW7_9BACL|nr:MMPL family transporter [Paenibacillus qinlingensis]MDR6551983.1 RND superfamily putative drug exporter [Paenibacillus qinlingensis]
MKPTLSHLAKFVSSAKGVRIVLISWLAAILLLSAFAPSSKEVAQSGGEGSLGSHTLSETAKQLLQEAYPSQDGLTAILVFHSQKPITDSERGAITSISTWLASDQKPLYVTRSLPFHQMPAAQQELLFSADRTTLLLTLSLQKDLASGPVYDTLEQIRHMSEQQSLGTMKLEITGPAGISSDTIMLFKKADIVLMLATLGIILVILIVIYRSPLLALLPLVIAGMVYAVVDRLIGLAGKMGWIFVEKQSLSIMMILLFAVLTDYCLFIIARYRSALRTTDSKYDAMSKAFSHVAEPIFFSGGTVLIAMLTLFTAVFKPYHSFAPVFAIAMVVILLGGLTLIPAMFALIGRRAFWPFIPREEASLVKEEPRSFWAWISTRVTTKPRITALVLIIVLLAPALSTLGTRYSFNLMKSFPIDISSRQGFEILEARFPQGELAPVTVLLESEKAIVRNESFNKKINTLTGLIQGREGISSLTMAVDPAQLTSEHTDISKHMKLQLILKLNPYDQAALDLISSLRKDSDAMLEQSGFEPGQFTLHYAGQTAEQLDVRTMNKRDTLVIFSLITILITLMLIWQSRSIRLALTMMATMLLSYAATMGIVWSVFHFGFGYDAFSYRLPVYTFIFLISLGVDYNIILVSRVQEESRRHPWQVAVQRGAALTGGVISSAGIVLAATFCVLMTQPLQELLLFGFAMAAGILIDTFLVRGMLLPALMTKMEPRVNTAKLSSRTWAP